MLKKIEKDGGTIGSATSGRLTETRIRRLEEIGFVWSVRDDWNKHFEELKQYRAQNGHCNVPARYSNRRLGVWVSSQRQQFKILQGLSKSKRATVPLNQHRIDLLNELQFTWSIRARSDNPKDNWKDRIAELKEFKSLNGHALIPANYYANPVLGAWAETLRKHIETYTICKTEGKPLPESFPLNDARIQELSEIGFVAIYPNRNEGVRDVLLNAEVQAMLESKLDSDHTSTSEEGSCYSVPVQHSRNNSFAAPVVFSPELGTHSEHGFKTKSSSSPARPNPTAGNSATSGLDSGSYTAV